MEAILVAQGPARELRAHGFDLLGVKRTVFRFARLQYASPSSATARCSCVGRDAVGFAAVGFQRMPVAHPDLRLPRMRGEHLGVDLDRLIELADARQDRGLQIVVAGIARARAASSVSISRRASHGLVLPMQDDRIVVAGGREARRELQAARQQVLGILVAAQPRRDFREHADGGDVGRIAASGARAARLQPAESRSRTGPRPPPAAAGRGSTP